MGAPGWQLWQWIDSAFPTGGYAHSGGLEAWAHLAPADAELAITLRTYVRTQARLALPYVRAAFEHDVLSDLDAFARLDGDFDAQSWGPSLRRASCVQGRALLDVSLRCFPDSVAVQRGRPLLGGDPPLHQPVVFGALARTFTTDVDEAARAHAFCGVRGVLSAAVRLNLVGPFEGQRLLTQLSDLALEADPGSSALEHAASTSPWLDLVAEQHDRLHTRLFST